MNVAVTGAWGYSGGRIARMLVERGHAVTSLTTHGPGVDGRLAGGAPDPFGGAVASASPAAAGAGDSGRRAASRGVGATAGGAGWAAERLTPILREWRTEVLVSTYWSRHRRRPLGHRGAWTGHDGALRNALALIEAARRAGVRKILWTSITNADRGVGLSYFEGKRRIEERLESLEDVECSVLRPACFYGWGGPGERPSQPGILVENVAWGCRRAPVFPIPEGPCRLRPIHVGDYARLVVREVEAGAGRDAGPGQVAGQREAGPRGAASEAEPEAGARRIVRDACGVDRYRFDDLVRATADAVGARIRVVRLGPWLTKASFAVASRVTGETILTVDEIEGLQRNLLDSEEEPAGGEDGIGSEATRLSRWIVAEGERLGRRLAREPRR